MDAYIVSHQFMPGAWPQNFYCTYRFGKLTADGVSDHLIGELSIELYY
jgi:hypothetical protein